ncbi:MAG: phospholipase D family protein, partial [Candidatus Aenigmarchaeota archaeon]|nr:phospholipase D family protein [Candidatus Aenigmarchaeota archaeon]
MIGILKNPWDKQFFDLVESSKREILISSPFIKMQPINTFVKRLSHNPKIRVLTSFKLTYFRRNVSDLEAIDELVKIGNVRNVGNLHSKVYIFDKTNAVITSSNLTYNGLTKNFEYGIILSDKKLVEKIY